MNQTNTIIIGGGQAGLAMSRCLTERSIPHCVFERGRIGERWRSERWDSLKLLTPNWQSRLPGFAYEGSDPNGYMSMPEVVGLLESYASSFSAPVMGSTTVESVERCFHDDSGYVVKTNRGVWQADNVVIATGDCDVPFVPEIAGSLDDRIEQIVPTKYRNPSQLSEGGVLVVGASATGVQLADEIHRSGRPVTLAVGRHIRLPRTYRGRDILWWLDAMGLLDTKIDEVFNAEISRRQPSLQLIGRSDGPLDLGVLLDRGVRLVGRADSIKRLRVGFADDLIGNIAAADVKLAQLLARVDVFIDKVGLSGKVAPREDFQPITPKISTNLTTELNLEEEGIRTVIWATGFRRQYSWLRVPVLDSRGELRHERGVTPAAGLYAIGLRFMRRRKSNFIDGVGQDAFELARHIQERTPTHLGSIPESTSHIHQDLAYAGS